MTDVFDEVSKNLEHVIRELDYLNNHQVAIGFFGGDDSQIFTIVRANEYGAHIKPKNGEYLWVPSKNAIKEYGRGVKNKDIPGLFVPKGKRVAVVNKDGKLVVYFYLLKKSVIPARAFLRKSFADHQKKYDRYIKVGLDEIAHNNGTGKQLLTKLGILAQTDIRNEMKRWTKPGNAPLTIDNKKGNNNPLVDTGSLIQHVTWKILPLGEIK